MCLPSGLSHLRRQAFRYGVAFLVSSEQLVRMPVWWHIWSRSTVTLDLTFCPLVSARFQPSFWPGWPTDESPAIATHTPGHDWPAQRLSIDRWTYYFQWTFCRTVGLIPVVLCWVEGSHLDSWIETGYDAVFCFVIATFSCGSASNASLRGRGEQGPPPTTHPSPRISLGWCSD